MLKFPVLRLRLWSFCVCLNRLDPVDRAQRRGSNGVPRGLVVDDFGRSGRVYRETDVETADLETVILDLPESQYKNPVRVFAFNTAEG